MPVGAIDWSFSRAFAAPFRVAGATAQGSFHGLTHSVTPTALGKQVVPFSSNPEYKYVAEFISEHLRNARSQVIPFFNTLRGSVAAGAESGYKAAFKLLMEGGVKARGIGLLVAGAAGAVLAVTAGLKMAGSSWHKVSQIDKGYTSSDPVTNKYIHMAQAATGGAMVMGGAMAFSPFAPIGIPLAAIGTVGSLGIAGIKYAIGGLHGLNLPDKLPYPFNRIAAAFRNQVL